MSIYFPTVHIYDLPFKDNISVKLNKSFLLYLLSKFKGYGNSRKVYEQIRIKQTYSTFKNYLKPSYRYFRPLDTLVQLCELARIPLDDLEKNIVEYQTLKGRITIKNPKLPIKVSPIFDMLIIHLMADGCCIRFKEKDTVYYFYRQYNKFFRDIFLTKSVKVFGNLEYNNNYFDNRKGVYLPEVLTLILLWYYNLKPENFLTKKSRLPKRILDKSKDFIISTLVAFIIDEGNIDSSGICIRLKNKMLIYDIEELIRKIGYNPKVTKSRRMYNVYLLVNDTRKFYKDYLKLKRKYPEISMGHKEEKLKLIKQRNQRELKNLPEGLTKNRIISLLKEKDITIKELSKKLKITRQGLRYHIKELEKLHVIKTYSKGKGFSCKLLKEVKFEVKDIGRCRPIGKTKNDILILLSKNNLNTYELARFVDITPNSLRHSLHDLENKGKIKRIGKQDRKIVWSIRNN